MRRKILSLTLSLSLFFQYPGFAQTLNLANYLSQSPNPLVSTDRFRPIQLKYFSYEPETSDFKILLDKGDQKNLSDIQVKDEANKLLTYFKIGLTLPNEKFWVNLRPDAQDQIIDPELEKTDIGKILLAADLQLKKDTASWTSPQTKEGREYWDKMYKRAGELLGSENVTIPTITRPWIFPGEIILKASDSSAYIYKANLKVMLEEDYLKSIANPITQTDYSFSDPRLKELNQYSTQLIRELIIPKLTKRINSSKDYVNLRQVYFSLILARWFKETFGNHQPPVSDRQPQDNSYINLINSHNLTGLNSKQAWDKTNYFKAFQKSFKQGEYRLSEPVYTPAGQVIRRYMSGGISVMGVSGSPLEWGIFQGSGDLFKKLTGTFKNLVGINFRKPNYLPEEGRPAGGAYYKSPAKKLDSRLQETNYSAKKGDAAVGSPLNLEGIKLAMKTIIEKEQLAQKVIPRIDDNPSYYSLSKIATKIKLTRNTKEDISNWEDIQKWLTQMVRYESEINRFMSNYKRKGILTASDKKEMDGYFMSNNLISAANKLSELAGGNTEMRWAFIYLEEDIREFMLYGTAREDSKSALSRIQQIIDKRSASTQRQITSGTGSSALTITENPETLGGIDLRQMNMLIQPQREFSGLDLTLPVLSSSAIEAMDLDKELTNIQQMVSSGIIPSGQRLKEFLAACFAKGKIEEKADSLVLCIADTFELQQMEAEESSLIYKEALVIADTRRYVLKKG